uniref:Uncharacterized protein n=1 Tax=Steinernema glaseri TaxID=37863 RepID=A0A1I8AMQ5_9BILA
MNNTTDGGYRKSDVRVLKLMDRPVPAKKPISRTKKATSRVSKKAATLPSSRVSKKATTVSSSSVIDV